MTTPDYQLLTTWAQCDAATADVTFELKTFSVRDANLALSDDRAGRSQSAGAAALAKKDADILSAQNMLARPGITQQQDEADALELLVAQRKQLVKRNRTTVGTAPFLADVDAVQVQGQGQVDVLTAVLTGIAAHRATLTA